jgi:hypothetical protein
MVYKTKSPFFVILYLNKVAELSNYIFSGIRMPSKLIECLSIAAT